MRSHFTLFAGIVFVLFAWAAGAVDSIPSPLERDGNWLRSGIREYEHFQNKDQQSLQNATLAIATIFYVRGVLDMQFSLNTKANVQAMVIQTSQQLKDSKQKLPQCELDSMRSSNKFFVPLSQTEFFSANYSPDQYMQFIKNYLEKHPEKWSKQADAIIEAAMLDAYPVAKQ
jgi:hypothetical protein